LRARPRPKRTQPDPLMKILLDFLPILLFFGTFKFAEHDAQGAADFATRHFGFLVSGGVVGPTEGPVLLATLVVIVATLVQIAFLLARGRKIDLMLWISLGLVTVLGGATVWFHNETFIKWKPSVLYWAMGLSFWLSHFVFRKNLLQTLMGEQLELPIDVWQRLNWAWIVFFGAMGVLNLYVAYSFSTDTWVNFKLFGSLGLMLLFTLAQGVYLSRHVKPLESAADNPLPTP
jgi:intracellular septation protein